MKKILFVNPHLKMGGIANSLFNLLNELSNDSQIEIDLLCFNPNVDDKFLQLTNNVNIISPLALQYFFISLKEARKGLKLHQFIIYLIVKVFSKIIGRNRIRRLYLKCFYRKLVKIKYDIAISFTNDIPKNNTNLGCNDLVEFGINSPKKIAWIHNDLKELGITRGYLLKRYKIFDTIVNVSNFCKDEFEDLVPEYINKSYIVHNFIDEEVIREKASLSNPFNNKSSLIFVTVARLENKQKRIDRILNSARILIDKGYDFQWYIIGDGPDFNKLENLKTKLNLSNNISFLGFKNNPYPYIKNADWFVLSSAYEAQGMVLSEALILDTPVITTNFPAAKEFVKHNQNGLITKNTTKSILNTLEKVLNPSSQETNITEFIKQNKINLSDTALKEFYILLQ